MLHVEDDAVYAIAQDGIVRVPTGEGSPALWLAESCLVAFAMDADEVVTIRGPESLFGGPSPQPPHGATEPRCDTLRASATRVSRKTMARQPLGEGPTGKDTEVVLASGTVFVSGEWGQDHQPGVWRATKGGALSAFANGAGGSDGTAAWGLMNWRGHVLWAEGATLHTDADAGALADASASMTAFTVDDDGTLTWGSGRLSDTSGSAAGGIWERLPGGPPVELHGDPTFPAVTAVASTPERVLWANTEGEIWQLDRSSHAVQLLWTAARVPGADRTVRKLDLHGDLFWCTDSEIWRAHQGAGQ